MSDPVAEALLRAQKLAAGEVPLTGPLTSEERLKQLEDDFILLAKELQLQAQENRRLQAQMREVLAAAERGNFKVNVIMGKQKLDAEAVLREPRLVLQELIKDCKQCGGRGVIPVGSAMAECKCRIEAKRRISEQESRYAAAEEALAYQERSAKRRRHRL